MTIAWWETIWASPMADEWVDGDIPALFRLARLDDLFWNATDSAEITRLAAEIRQQQSRFGLTPMDRRALQWEIHRVERLTKGPKPVSGRARDPRSILRSLA